ncbi:O-methylsterigmatocystin oxidoreductase [Penicillium longicatenatum]|uniref:O-methylsterigmatocystin oxidoreductase n=1 Tax=Penicillium longicatenatum TaxID=1561947 RepID=UPI00254722F9|nr:O-methylsterigmatocystin oxidoreductase [Penicillium longicatenatum]KAJ5631640.1 O-methylsterigmatocystin oxidoreductase [Penicillium longicatenatum]
MFYLSWAILLAGSICLSHLVWSYLQEEKSWRRSNIPRPLGHPIFGSKHQLGSHPAKRLEKLGLSEGELFSVKFGFKHFVYVNSYDAVREIFDRQATKTSAKGPWRGATQIVSGLRIAIMPGNMQWRRLRTILHRLLHPTVARFFRPSQEFEAKQLLCDLLESGGKDVVCKEQAHRMALSVIMTSTYGHRVASMQEDPICHQVDQIMQDFSQATAPGVFITDLIPQLDNLPVRLQWWRPQARKFHERQYAVWMPLWQELRRRVTEGTAPSCFAKHFMEADMQRFQIDETQAAFLAGTLIEAGSDTSASALNIAIKYLAANPSVLDQAHAEVSRVVGDDKSPSFDDIDRLPFIHACIKEVSRIRPLTKFGTAHYTTDMVTYKQYRIPPGCFVVINQCAIHNNPEYYDQPGQFDPGRYLRPPFEDCNDEQEKFNSNAIKAHLNFGAGRRICPGLHVAESSLFIALAKLVWLFDIQPEADKNGNPLPMDVSDAAFEDGANNVPKPFRVRFVSRSAAREERAWKDWKTAKMFGFEIRDVKVNLDGVIVE